MALPLLPLPPFPSPSPLRTSRAPGAAPPLPSPSLSTCSPAPLLPPLPSLASSTRNVPRCCAAGEAEAKTDPEIFTPDGYFPDAKFYKVEAVVRPWRLTHVTTGLLRAGIRGVTVSDVRGLGAQGGARERQAGSEFGEDSFVSKVKLEVVVSKDQVDAVINTVIDQARTGEIGDGKIFVVPVADVIRVRTGERGLKGERMAGGRAEILSASNGNMLN